MPTLDTLRSQGAIFAQWSAIHSWGAIYMRIRNRTVLPQLTGGRATWWPAVAETFLNPRFTYSSSVGSQPSGVRVKLRSPVCVHATLVRLNVSQWKICRHFRFARLPGKIRMVLIRALFSPRLKRLKTVCVLELNKSLFKIKSNYLHLNINHTGSAVRTRRFS